MLKCRNNSTTTRNYAVTYYKILEEAPLHLLSWATVGWGDRWGMGGGQHLGVSSTSKNRPLRALNVHWALPVYPVFEDEKSNASDEKLVKRKIA